jgi:hypothetical protein
MGTSNPSPTPEATPPAAGKVASVRVDQILHEDLAALMACGMTASDAVRHAVDIVAVIYRNAWKLGAYPEHVAPVIVSVDLVPYDSVGRSDQDV